MSSNPLTNGDLPGMILPAGLPLNIHLLGLGGAGVSGAARILKAMGKRVTGHDCAPSPMLSSLEGLGIPCSLGKSTDAHLPGDAAMVVRSAAVPDEDPQVQAAYERGIPVLKYAELLGKLLPSNSGLGVAGTHGKTTTSAMLAWILSQHQPIQAFLGGIATNFNSNCRPGPAEVSVVEADEFGSIASRN